jgi:serine protease Do
LRAGTAVFAVGNPFGFVGAVSSGIIHAVGPLRFANGPRWDLHWIQADVRLAPGNSGGPLATFDGQVIGLNTMIISGGLSLAVPSRSVTAFLARSHDGPLLGVTVRPIETRAGDLGLLILEIDPGSAAQAASLLPGDILRGANETKFRCAEDLENALVNTAGDSILLDFQRGGNSSVRHVAVQLRRGGLSSAA